MRFYFARKILTIMVCAATVCLVPATANASALNVLLGHKWQNKDKKHAELLPSAVANCKLNMKNNSIQCQTAKIDGILENSDVVYVTSSEISGFKGNKFTISPRRNFSYVMPLDADNPNAKPPSFKEGENTMPKMDCSLDGKKITCDAGGTQYSFTSS